MQKNKKQILVALCEGAMFIALAEVLSLFSVFKLPWGGSITLSTVPIVLYSVRYGLPYGLSSGFVFGVLQFFTDNKAINFESMIGDYILAFAVLGLAGIFKRKKYGVFYGAALGCAARFLVHYVVGATVWAEYMPERFFGMTMHTPWFYSFLYNISYNFGNFVLAVAVFGLFYKRMGKYLRGEDLTEK